MWYAIIAGLALALGLGLGIWALNERSSRHAAERRADEAISFRVKAEEVAKNNVRKVDDLEGKLASVELQLSNLRGRLEEARTRLAEAGDPKAIKEWLDAELVEEEL